jgi:hypothetical protein
MEEEKVAARSRRGRPLANLEFACADQCAAEEKTTDAAVTCQGCKKWYV